jgi:hypothetical protein
MELLENIIPPATTHGSDKCPFCPAQKDDKLTTYPGSANNSGMLQSIMENPADLQKYQECAWPHDGNKHPTRAEIEKTYEYSPYGNFEFQAHHLLSGKQALEDHAFEKWIVASKETIAKDTGYAINGSLNGIWAPSYPKGFRSGEYKWGELDPSERKKIAVYIMMKAHCQFHLGHHAIDPKDGPEVKHDKYDKYLKDNLTEMDSRMTAWSAACPVCSPQSGPQQKPFRPNERVNMYLNALSEAAQKRITASVGDWVVFLSALARDYHKDHCDHQPQIPAKRRRL